MNRNGALGQTSRIDDNLGHVCILTEIQALAWSVNLPGRGLNLATSRPSTALVLSCNCRAYTDNSDSREPTLVYVAWQKPEA
jgi:hypothetical protein